MTPPPVHAAQDHQEASQQAAKTGDKFDRIQFEVMREGARFFERLALLNGGALVLSVSFLGYLSARPQANVANIFILYVAWGFLMAGLLASTFRNLYQQSYVYFATVAPWAEAGAKLKEVELKVLQDADGRSILVDSAHKPLSSEEQTKFLEMLGKKRDSWTKLRDKAEGRAASYERAFVALDLIAQIGFVVGLLLMVSFAVANAP